MAVMAAAGLWMLGLLDRVIMPMVVLSGLERRVPDLHHLGYEDADSVCRSLALELIPIRERVEANLLPGSILDQFPDSGAVVKPGRRIEVVVGAKVERFAVPNLTGVSLREAEIIADSAGLSVDENSIRYQVSDEYPEGVVLGQSPRAGTLCYPGGRVMLTVSLGGAIQRIVAPDLIGRRLDEVGLILAKYSLRLGAVAQQVNRNFAPRTIFFQDPPAEKPMRAGEAISVRVAAETPAESP
jgi:serine/threonine-protein kinase